jgi:hypothetical protein
MYDGTASPLGELLSLLCYGLSLRRSAAPAFWVEWSDDSETISWNSESSLSIDQFRGIVLKALVCAREQMSHLLFNWEPLMPDFKKLRDRLSNVSSGYSFVVEPANGLRDGYIQLLQRACTSLIDGLIKDRGGSLSSWDRRAVMAWLAGHDRAIRTLMALARLSGGKPARIIELLTLEVRNSSSRLRGIGLYRGWLFSTTRVHKARRRTNNEFQVARFYPSPVRELLFRYMVYIRSFADLLRRQCLGEDGLGDLLFTPALSQYPLTAAALTTELRRLSSSVLPSSVPFGSRIYRQLVIAIVNRHIKPIAQPFDRHLDTGHGAKCFL